MPKKMISIATHTHDKIKINAELEKRSVTNYIECLIETLFVHNEFIKSNGILYIQPDTTIIKKNNVITKDVKLVENIENKNNNNDIINDTINDIQPIFETRDLDATYISYIELEKLGRKLRLDNDAKPDHLKSSAYIFDSKISDHERGWLYKNPTCTLIDYKKAFPDMF